LVPPRRLLRLLSFRTFFSIAYFLFFEVRHDA
jgi:hypothetical protein